MAASFDRFTAALRAELGLPSAKGVVAVDGKSLRSGYERGRKRVAAFERRLRELDWLEAAQRPDAALLRSRHALFPVPQARGYPTVCAKVTNCPSGRLRVAASLDWSTEPRKTVASPSDA